MIAALSVCVVLHTTPLTGAALGLAILPGKIRWEHPLAGARRNVLGGGNDVKETRWRVSVSP